MPYVNNDNMSIDLTEIPKDTFGRNKWKESEGKTCKFNYKGTEGKLTIVKYINAKLIIVSYNDNEYTIHAELLKRGNLYCLFNSHPSKDFKIEINSIIESKNEKLLILDREYRTDGKTNRKFYKYRCLTCDYEDWMLEHHLQEGKGCKRCNSNNYHEEGFNDIPTKAPWMVDYFQGGIEEAKKYKPCSKDYLIFKCPFCGRLATHPISISNLYKIKSIGCECTSNRVSIPETIMIHLLKLFNTKFQTQLSCVTFKWVGKYRYDFYLPDYNCIIETNGALHYVSLCRGRTLEEELENDRLKKELAKLNGIKHYYSINCSHGTVNEILRNSVKEGLLQFLNISIDAIDTTLLNRRDSDVTIVKEIEQFMRDNPTAIGRDIKKHFNINNYKYMKYMLQIKDLPEWYTRNRRKKGGSICQNC